MLIAIIILSIALISAIALCAWSLSEKRSVFSQYNQQSQQIELLQSEKQALDEKATGLQVELAEAKKDYENLKNDSAKASEQFEKAQQAARDRFKSIADEVLEKANKQFLDRASERLKGDQKQAEAALEKRQQAIKSLVDPIKESLNKYNENIQQIEKERKGAYGSLSEKIKGLYQAQQDLSKETQNLGKALRRPEVRGRWGEMQLRRVAELSGMIENCDFYQQQSSSDNSARPDMVVKLPGDRTIIVDAKTPFDAFMQAMDSTDDTMRNQLLDRHSKQVEDQVKNLSKKNYQSNKDFGRTPAFVVLFLPSESFLEAAIRRKPDLVEKAMENNVVIATPATLISLLKAVAAGWREQQVAENAQRISALAQELHKRLCTAVSHLSNLGKAVGKTVEHYNKFLGSMESQVLSQARRFEQLGSDSHKKLPKQMTTIDTTPREITKNENEVI